MFQPHLCRESWFLWIPPSVVGLRYINIGAKCQWRCPWLPSHPCGADRYSTVGLEVCVFLEWHLETRWDTLTHLNELHQYGHSQLLSFANQKKLRTWWRISLSGIWNFTATVLNGFSVISLGGDNFSEYLMCKLEASVLHRDENK